jgi:hypothetical protein
MSTATMNMPPVITVDQVRRACAGPLADSSVCARVREQRETWQEWERERDAEGVQLRQAREARQAETAERRQRARAEDLGVVWRQELAGTPDASPIGQRSVGCPPQGA